MTKHTRIICIGAMLWDVIGYSPRRVKPRDDVAGRIRRRPGGVALNVALALARQGLAPVMLSAVGRDLPGDMLVTEAQRRGLETSQLWRDDSLPTDMYLAVESPDGLMAAIADARLLETAGAAVLAPLREGPLGSAAAPWSGAMVIDGNLTLNVISALARDPCFARAQLRIVPASTDKASRLWPLLNHPNAVFHLNLAESEALTGRSFDDAVTAAEAVLALGASRVLVTNGAHAAADALRGDSTLSQSPPAVTPMRVTGAGDNFVAAHLASELAGGTRAQALMAAVHTAAAYVAGKDQP